MHHLHLEIKKGHVHAVINMRTNPPITGCEILCVLLFPRTQTVNEAKVSDYIQENGTKGLKNKSKCNFVKTRFEV